jgi:hypothetical protein
MPGTGLDARGPGVDAGMYGAAISHINRPLTPRSGAGGAFLFLHFKFKAAPAPGAPGALLE